jgi:hypothetical protein
MPAEWARCGANWGDLPIRDVHLDTGSTTVGTWPQLESLSIAVESFETLARVREAMARQCTPYAG